MFNQAIIDINTLYFNEFLKKYMDILTLFIFFFFRFTKSLFQSALIEYFDSFNGSLFSLTTFTIH